MSGAGTSATTEFFDTLLRKHPDVMHDVVDWVICEKELIDPRTEKLRDGLEEDRARATLLLASYCADELGIPVVFNAHEKRLMGSLVEKKPIQEGKSRITFYDFVEERFPTISKDVLDRLLGDDFLFDAETHKLRGDLTEGHARAILMLSIRLTEECGLKLILSPDERELLSRKVHI